MLFLTGRWTFGYGMGWGKMWGGMGRIKCTNIWGWGRFWMQANSRPNYIADFLLCRMFSTSAHSENVILHCHGWLVFWPQYNRSLLCSLSQPHPVTTLLNATISISMKMILMNASLRFWISIDTYNIIISLDQNEKLQEYGICHVIAGKIFD